jgi:tripartite-type tricarboxylate transporter receptor subunit TctC
VLISMKKCKRFIGVVLWIACTLVISACSSASQGEEVSGDAGSDFPNKPVTIIVHTSAGGPTDTMARKLASAAEPFLGEKIIVENKPGGSGATQMSALQSAGNDGYTVATITPSHLGAWNTTLKGQFGPNDFAFVSNVQLDPYVLAVNADSEFETLEDLVSYMKEHPGEVKIGGYGAVGSGHNVAWNIFADTAGVEGTWVNYESTGDAATALLGNHIDVTNNNPEKVAQYVESGELRVLGVLAQKRLESMPDVPTYKEAGIPVEIDWAQFRGIYTNADVPEKVQAKLSDAFLKAMETEDFKQYMRDSQLETADMGHKEFSEFIDNQLEVNNDWLEKLGLN